MDPVILFLYLVYQSGLNKSLNQNTAEDAEERPCASGPSSAAAPHENAEDSFSSHAIGRGRGAAGDDSTVSSEPKIQTHVRKQSRACDSRAILRRWHMGVGHCLTSLPTSPEHLHPAALLPPQGHAWFPRGCPGSSFPGSSGRRKTPQAPKSQAKSKHMPPQTFKSCVFLHS